MRTLLFPILHFSFFIFHSCLTPQALADDSPKHAERGVQAYQAGKYDLARIFFTKALHDAVLKGKEEWIAKATLNLVDLELEAQEEAEAERLLEGFTSRDAGMRSLILWKRSQLSFLRRRHDLALSQIDSALDLAGSKDKARETVLLADRLRYRIAHQDPASWAGDHERLRRRLAAADPGKAAGLDASAAMARREFARADTLWKAAIAWHRERGRLAKVAACMNQAALALYSLGRREEALEMNARAVAVFTGMGLAMPGLRAQALRLLISDDHGELAKLRQDMDLVGQRLGGFDLQGILDEYSHNLGGAPSRPASP